MLRANYGGLPLNRAPVEPTDPAAANYEQLRTDMAVNREQRQGMFGPATEYEKTQAPATGKGSHSYQPPRPPAPLTPTCPPGFTLTEFGCATRPSSGPGFYNSVAQCPPGTLKQGDLCYLQTPTPENTATFYTPPLPTPQTPTTLIDQSQPGMLTCWNGMQVPVGAACPPITPQVPDTETIGFDALAFWRKYKTPILVGGGLLSVAGILALVLGSRRRGLSAPSPY